MAITPSASCIKENKIKCGLIQQNYFDSGSNKIMSPEYRMVAQLGEQLKKKNLLIMFVIMTAKYSSMGQRVSGSNPFHTIL